MYYNYKISGKRINFIPKSYHYRSFLTKDVINGMELLFRRVQKIEKNLIGKNILDIGCNDGSLLNIFKKASATLLGVEPTDAGKVAKKNHIIFNDFFDKKLAKKIHNRIKKVDVIIFTNVLLT